MLFSFEEQTEMVKNFKESGLTKQEAWRYIHLLQIRVNTRLSPEEKIEMQSLDKKMKK